MRISKQDDARRSYHNDFIRNVLQKINLISLELSKYNIKQEKIKKPIYFDRFYSSK